MKAFLLIKRNTRHLLGGLPNKDISLSSIISIALGESFMEVAERIGGNGYENIEEDGGFVNLIHFPRELFKLNSSSHYWEYENNTIKLSIVEAEAQRDGLYLYAFEKALI